LTPGRRTRRSAARGKPGRNRSRWSIRRRQRVPHRHAVRDRVERHELPELPGRDRDMRRDVLDDESFPAGTVNVSSAENSESGIPMAVWSLPLRRAAAWAGRHLLRSAQQEGSDCHGDRRVGHVNLRRSLRGYRHRVADVFMTLTFRSYAACASCSRKTVAPKTALRSNRRALKITTLRILPSSV
jgi:hypothetical protein